MNKKLSTILGLVAVAMLVWVVVATVVKNKKSQETYTPAVVSVEQVMDVLPEAASVVYADTALYKVLNTNNEQIGTILLSEPYSKTRGFAGPTPLQIVADSENRIISVELFENRETPGYVNFVKKSGLFEKWNGLTVSEAAVAEVDAVSGATFTSRSVINSMKVRLAAADRQQQKTVSAFDWSIVLKQIPVLAVVVLALVCFFKPKAKTLRTITLILSIIVIGLYRNSLISLAVFFGWLTNGVPLALQISLIVIAVLAVLLPFFFGKAFYCTYLCPFGAAQEFMGRCNKNHITLPHKVAVALEIVRRVILIAVLLLLALGLIGADLLAEIEPFSAFSVQSTSVWMGVFAIAILIVSIFINRPWCHYFCPTGQLLDLFRQFSVHKSNNSKKC